MEEVKKMKCCKRLMYDQFVQVSGLCGPQFWVTCRNVSCTFVELFMETPYWCTGNQQKHLEFTFSIKTLSFHSRTSICAHKHIFKYLKWLYCWKSRGETFFSVRQHSYFDVTDCENSEIQIAVLSKWNMLREWKLVQRFTFCLSST